MQGESWREEEQREKMGENEGEVGGKFIEKGKGTITRALSQRHYIGLCKPDYEKLEKLGTQITVV